MSRLIELYNKDVDKSYMYFLDSDGTVWVHTDRQTWKVSGFTNFDLVLDSVREDKEHYIVTEFEMKGQWNNRG